VERILAIDYGEKRIGIAVSDPLGLTAQPKPFLPNDKKLITNLLSLIEEYTIAQVLVGLPLHTKGHDSPKSLEVRKWVEVFKQHCSLPIRFVDERFSTQAAHRQLQASEISMKNRKTFIDSQAAAFFLEGFLARRTH